MSRSHKKYPSWKDNHRGGAKIGKRFANKRVRRTEEIWNGGSYKRLYPTYDIVDYRFTDYEWRKERPLYVYPSRNYVLVKFENDYYSYEMEPPLSKRNNPDHMWWRGYFK